MIRREGLKQLIQKLETKADSDEMLKVIYMWVKQENITRDEFILLVEWITNRSHDNKPTAPPPPPKDRVLREDGKGLVPPPKFPNI